MCVETREPRVPGSEVVSAPIQVTRPAVSSGLGPWLSSSRLDLGSAESDIVKRNLITDFWSGTSLPVNIPPHRSESAQDHDHTA